MSSSIVNQSLPHLWRWSWNWLSSSFHSHFHKIQYLFGKLYDSYFKTLFMWAPIAVLFQVVRNLQALWKLYFFPLYDLLLKNCPCLATKDHQTDVSKSSFSFLYLFLMYLVQCLRVNWLAFHLSFEHWILILVRTIFQHCEELVTATQVYSLLKFLCLWSSSFTVAHNVLNCIFLFILCMSHLVFKLDFPSIQHILTAS